MLIITDEEKALFKESGHFPGYIFTFSDIDLVITNETIHDQAVTVKESIMDSSELTLGGCIASSIEFEVSEIMANDITGHEFTARLEVTDADDNVELSNLPMGTYTPTTVQQVDDKDYKKVTAYDRLTRATADVSDWYNTWFGDGDTHTVKETRESLLTCLGIPYVVQNLTNDTYVCEKTVESAQMIGLDILKMLCAINGGFGRMNRSGQFEVITLAEITGSEPDTSEDYRTVKYEEYTSEAVTGIIVKGTTDDVGIDVGDKDTNPYIITGNIFFYNNSTDDQKTAIRTVATNILNLIKNIEYRPHTSNIDGLPYMECGDIFKIEKENDTLESYIFSRTLSGVAYLQDQYEAKGTQERKNEVSATSEMYRNAGKQFVFTTSVDGLKAELKNFETNTETKFELTDGEIKQTVATAQSKYVDPQPSPPEPSGTDDITVFMVSDLFDGATVNSMVQMGDMLTILLSNGYLAQSTDGTNWTIKGRTPYASPMTALGCTNSMYILGGTSEADGHSVFFQANSDFSSFIRMESDYDSGDQKIVEISNGGPRPFAISEEGAEWYYHDGFFENDADDYCKHQWYKYGTSVTLYDRIRYINGKYLHTGYGDVWYRDDDTPWSPGDDGWTAHEPDPMPRILVRDVTYGNNVYVAVGVGDSVFGTDKGAIYTSTDLDTWELATELDFIPTKVIFTGDLFYVISSLRQTYYSVDGKEWTQGISSIISSDPESQYLGCVNGNVVIADGNRILTHPIIVHTPYTIELYGYGDPNGSNFYTKAENIGKYYLDQNTGTVYYLEGDGTTWTIIEVLEKIDDVQQSQIIQHSNEIVMKVDSNGNVVQVALSASPEEGTAFKVGADNIELSADQVINLLSNNAINMTAKNISIVSDYFNVTDKGEVTAGALRITGGGFDVETNSSNINVLRLKGVSGLENIKIMKTGTEKKSPDYAGEGVPDSEFGIIGDFYLDISSAKVYEKVTNSLWNELQSSYYDASKNDAVYINEATIDTENGFSITSFNYVVAFGERQKQEVSSGTKIGECRWSISAKNGKNEVITKEATLKIEIEKFTGSLYEDFEHRLTSDTPIKVPKLEIGEEWEETTQAGGTIPHDSPNLTSNNGNVSLNDSSRITLPIVSSDSISSTDITGTNITGTNFIFGNKQLHFAQASIAASDYPNYYQYLVSGLATDMPVHVCLANTNDNFGTITKYGINQTNSSIEIYHDVGSYTGTITYNIMYFTNIT